MSRLFKSEPTLIVSAVRAVLLLIAGFGLDLSSEQIVLVLAVVEAVLALFNRSQVFSSATVEEKYVPALGTDAPVPPDDRAERVDD